MPGRARARPLRAGLTAAGTQALIAAAGGPGAGAASAANAEGVIYGYRLGRTGAAGAAVAATQQLFVNRSPDASQCAPRPAPRAAARYAGPTRRRLCSSAGSVLLCCHRSLCRRNRFGKRRPTGSGALSGGACKSAQRCCRPGLALRVAMALGSLGCRRGGLCHSLAGPGMLDAKPCSPVTAPAGRRNPVFARTLALSADGVRLLAAGGAPSGALGAPPGGAPAGTAPSRAYIFRLQSCGTRAQAADPVGA